MSNSVVPKTSVGGIEHWEKCTAVLAPAFMNDALVRMFFAEKNQLPTADGINERDMFTYWTPLVKDTLQQGGEIVEACSWAAVAVWRPPQSNTMSNAPNAVSRPPVAGEYLEKRDKMKATHLKGRQYWFLHMLGRNPSQHIPGAIRALIQPYLERARSEGLPVWVEATNTHARDVYIHFGFRTVGTAVIGEQSPYTPVTVYGMIKEP